MCKKKTSVSHSLTESEIISLDAGLRLDGITALDLWDLIVAVLHGNTNQSNQAQGDLCMNQSLRQTIIIHFTSISNIVMWEIQLNNVVWDCFKTLILQEILKILNRPQAEHCAHLEAIHLLL